MMFYCENSFTTPDRWLAKRSRDVDSPITVHLLFRIFRLTKHTRFDKTQRSIIQRCCWLICFKLTRHYPGLCKTTILSLDSSRSRISTSREAMFIVSWQQPIAELEVERAREKEAWSKIILISFAWLRQCRKTRQTSNWQLCVFLLGFGSFSTRLTQHLWIFAISTYVLNLGLHFIYLCDL